MKLRCSKCGLIKEEEEFPIDYRNNRPRAICIKCSRQANKDNYTKQKLAGILKLKDHNPSRNALCNALRDGKIQKIDACEVCGKGPTEAHHSSYDPDMYLVVTWLCRSCHRLLHEEHRARYDVP